MNQTHKVNALLLVTAKYSFHTCIMVHALCGTLGTSRVNQDRQGPDYLE